MSARLFQCKRCLRFFQPDTECDDGCVDPEHPMKVLLSQQPESWEINVEDVTPFVCDLEDCAREDELKLAVDRRDGRHPA